MEAVYKGEEVKYTGARTLKAFEDWAVTLGDQKMWDSRIENETTKQEKAKEAEEKAKQQKIQKEKDEKEAKEL